AATRRATWRPARPRAPPTPGEGAWELYLPPPRHAWELYLPPPRDPASGAERTGAASAAPEDFAMTAAPTAGRRPTRRGLLLVVVALVVSSAAASATAVALGSRSDLSSSRRRVDHAWVALRPALDARYQRLG